MEDENSEDNYIKNNEIKIVDIIPDTFAGLVMMFNNTKEADEFYKNLVDNSNNNNTEADYFKTLVSRATFTNKIIPPDEEKPEAPVPNKPEQPKRYRSPKTADTSSPTGYMALLVLSSTIVALYYLTKENAEK